MSRAEVTLKLSPEEARVIRRAVEAYSRQLKEQTDSASPQDLGALRMEMISAQRLLELL